MHHVDALAHVHGLAYSRGTAGKQQQQGGQGKERARGHSGTIRAHLCRSVVVPYAKRPRALTRARAVATQQTVQLQ